MRTTTDVYSNYRKLGERLWAKYKSRMRDAHPATGGSPDLVHNWGNDEAKTIQLQYNRRSTALIKRGRREYNRAEHFGDRTHTGGRYLWCPLCRGGKA